MRDDGFHPDLQPSELLTRHRVHHVKSSEIDSDTAQSEACSASPRSVAPRSAQRPLDGRDARPAADGIG